MRVGHMTNIFNALSTREYRLLFLLYVNASRNCIHATTFAIGHKQIYNNKPDPKLKKDAKTHKINFFFLPKIQAEF